MISVYLTGGIGNQLYQYATGRRLADKLGTDLELNVEFYEKYRYYSYVLPAFNLREFRMTRDDYYHVAKRIPQDRWVIERNTQIFMPEVLDCPDNVYLYGSWEDERYFADIADDLRQEFTFRQPLGAAARLWQEKISAAQCSVSVHVRHGDFTYNPIFTKRSEFMLLPHEYYRDCINQLKRKYPNITVFVFSNDLNWCKENFHFDAPTEFVAGDGLTDVEEFRLMSTCQHNVIANSTFSWWAAWLNHNPNKKIFAPIPSDIAGTKKFYRHFSAERNENSPLESDKWIRVPFDADNQPAVNMRPYFSLLMVVNDNAATLRESLETVFAQDYRYFELIIVDNASTDGSRELCQNVAAHENVTLIKLFDRVQDGAAWNIALDAAQGKFVMFLRGDDKFFPDALTRIYLANERIVADVVHSFAHLRESDDGNITDDAGKKFVIETERAFDGLEGVLRVTLKPERNLVADETKIRNLQLPALIHKIYGITYSRAMFLKILADNYCCELIGTDIFKREFLTGNALRFNERLDGRDAELQFTVNAMIQTDEVVFMSEIFYIAPPNP